MGELTMNAGIFTFTPSTGGELALNFRYPQGVSEEGIEIKFRSCLGYLWRDDRKRRTRKIAALRAG